MNSHVSFTVWKSTRKNSKVEMIDIFHFEDVSQEQDIEKITSAVSKIINRMEKLNTKRIILSACIQDNKHLDKLACNDVKYDFSDVIGIWTDKREYFSIEKAINFVYACYMFAAPNSNLSLRTLHDHPSIRYYINQFYNGK